jgi:hypothetical protein
LGGWLSNDRLDSICPHASENLGNSGEKITENASHARAIMAVMLPCCWGGGA